MHLRRDSILAEGARQAQVHLSPFSAGGSWVAFGRRPRRFGAVDACRAGLYKGASSSSVGQAKKSRLRSGGRNANTSASRYFAFCTCTSFQT